MQTNTPTRPVILSNAEIYDQLMSAIEPDLTTNQVPLLDQKYANETEQDEKVRMERYNKAFEAFDLALTQYLSELHTQVANYCSSLRKHAEKESSQEENLQLTNIEKQFSL